MSDINHRVLKALDHYQSAVLAKDANRFMQTYDADVRVFDTWGIWSYEGAAAWRVAVEAWFSSLGSETVRVTFEDIKVIAEPHMAFMSCFARFCAISAQGIELRAMQSRMTWVLQTRDDVLRVVHEHTSVPIGFEDTKAIFESN